MAKSQHNPRISTPPAAGTHHKPRGHTTNRRDTPQTTGTHHKPRGHTTNHGDTPHATGTHNRPIGSPAHLRTAINLHCAGRTHLTRCAPKPHHAVQAWEDENQTHGSHKTHWSHRTNKTHKSPAAQGISCGGAAGLPGLSCFIGGCPRGQN